MQEAPNADTPPPARNSTHWIIAPVLLLAIVIDLLCVAAVFRIPLKLVSPFLFWPLIISALIALACGMLSLFPQRLIIATLILGAVSLLSVRHNWQPSCAVSDSVIASNDAWSYAAFGKYLWENSRGVDTGLSLPDEYASHLKNTRFAGSGLLAFLSLFSRPGDPASAMVLLVLVCDLAAFCSLFYLCQALGLSTNTSIGAGFLGVLTGWLSNAVLVGNIDTLLFIPLFIGFIGALIAIAEVRDGPRVHSLALVLCSSAAFYCYPEGFGIGVLIAVPIGAWTLHRTAVQRRAIRTAALVGIAVLVVSPYLGMAFEFFRNQFAMSTAGTRPGEGYFPGLLHASSFLPAIYALGEEYPHSDVAAWNWLLPMVLSTLIFMGVWRFKNTARFFVLSLVPFCILAVWQALALYSYGLYKVLVVGSFLLVPMMAEGLSIVVTRMGLRPGRALALGVALIILLSAFEREEDHPYFSWRGQGCVTQVRDLASLRFLSPNKAIVVDIPDVFLQSWAIYYMRDVNTILPSPVGYLAMPHIKPFLARARSVSSLPIIGRLHMGSVREAIWSDGDFSVVPADMPQIVGVSNPNGVEVVDGGQFVWVGPDPLSLDVMVPRKGRYTIKAAQFVPGPSLPGKVVRTVKVDQDSGSFTIDIGPDATGIPVELPQGRSTVRISCLDQRTIMRFSNGDTRPLLLGIRALSILPEEQPVKAK